MLLYIPERKVLIFFDTYNTQLRTRYMDVSVTNPGWSSTTITLSQPLSTGESWAAALWDPDDHRILLGDVANDPNAIYEVALPSNLSSDSWTVVRSPLTNGDTILWAPSTTYKKWSYNEKIKAVVYMPYASRAGSDDVVYVYRPRSNI